MAWCLTILTHLPAKPGGKDTRNLEQTHGEAGKQGSTTAQMETNKVAPVYRYVMSNSNILYADLDIHMLRCIGIGYGNAWTCVDAEIDKVI